MSDLPHVTAILRDAGLVDTTWFSDYVRDRGSALHKATELYDLAELDLDSVDDAIRLRLQGYDQFLLEVEPEIVGIEEKVMYPGVYQGTLDRRLVINGKMGILDIKSTPSKVDPLQLAGYALTFPNSMARWNLYLGIKEGTYKLVERKEPKADDRDWWACVNIAAFKRRHGLLKGA